MKQAGVAPLHVIQMSLFGEALPHPTSIGNLLFRMSFLSGYFLSLANMFLLDLSLLLSRHVQTFMIPRNRLSLGERVSLGRFRK